MNNLALADWASLFSAELGAAATLLGLVFVGISINLNRIMASGTLVNRALEGVILLLGVLAVSTAGLVPVQPVTWLGWETLVIGLVVWCVLVLLQARAGRRLAPGMRAPFVIRVVMCQVATLTFIIGGALLLGGTVAGLGALTLGMLFATMSAVIDSWVLLVEILR